MEQHNTEHPRLELSSQLVTIMTTEHYNLRMALSMNTTEISGRSSLFVGAVSSALIALAFVGQVSHLGTAFFVFGLVVLAALVVMGLITFERVLESSNTQFMYAPGITRIRHLYLEYAPQMRPYFILSAHDDVEGALMDMGVMHSSGWQGFFSREAWLWVAPKRLFRGETPLCLPRRGQTKEVEPRRTIAVQSRCIQASGIVPYSSPALQHSVVVPTDERHGAR